MDEKRDVKQILETRVKGRRRRERPINEWVSEEKEEEHRYQNNDTGSRQ